ncbi:MAG TPA: transposase [Candidatus Moranbacteria bacterium]|nr:transposase [Candidatus Moranbacteria bacterium]
MYRFYKKRKLIRKPQKKPPWYAPLKNSLIIDKPGVGAEPDVKYVSDEKGRRKCQFGVCDPFTRLYHRETFNTRESKNATLALKNAQAVWGFSFCSVQTDNGGEFRGEFHNYLEKAGIAHRFIPKKSPWWNGIVERIHRSMDEEYHCNPRRKWKSPKDWVRFYNTERNHLGLEGITPREKLESVTVDC